MRTYREAAGEGKWGIEQDCSMHLNLVCLLSVQERNLIY